MSWVENFSMLWIESVILWFIWRRRLLLIVDSFVSFGIITSIKKMLLVNVFLKFILSRLFYIFATVDNKIILQRPIEIECRTIS